MFTKHHTIADVSTFVFGSRSRCSTLALADCCGALLPGCGHWDLGEMSPFGLGLPAPFPTHCLPKANRYSPPTRCGLSARPLTRELRVGFGAWSAVRSVKEITVDAFDRFDQLFGNVSTHPPTPHRQEPMRAMRNTILRMLRVWFMLNVF